MMVDVLAVQGVPGRGIMNLVIVDQAVQRMGVEQ